MGKNKTTELGVKKRTSVLEETLESNFPSDAKNYFAKSWTNNYPALASMLSVTVVQLLIEPKYASLSFPLILTSEVVLKSLILFPVPK